MNRNHVVAAALATVFALTACGGGSNGTSMMPSSGTQNASSLAVGSAAIQPEFENLTPDNGYYRLTSPGAARPACPAVAGSHAIRCFAWMRTDLHPSLVETMPGTNAIPSGLGYSPQQIQAAYHLNPALGSGQTVYIIDAYGYSTAASDLAKYRAAAGLPACGAGCLQILNQEGRTSPLPKPCCQWDFEQSLDLDAVSAACPKCKIVLVESNTSGSIYSGVNVALHLHGTIVSMSFGGPEQGPASIGFPTTGAVFVASAGDEGGGTAKGSGPEMPCTYAEIVCAGGTSLVHRGNTYSESAWNDEQIDGCGATGREPCGATGSACSAIVPKPSWQSAGACPRRAAADVSAVASPQTPLAIYNTPTCHGWCAAGGTSLAAPLIAGVFALAGNASTRHAATEIWQSHAHFNDVKTGTNIYLPVTGPCASTIPSVCKAGPGYDGPTGWGTPNTSASF
jgi:subtilase family serine protease